MKSPERDHVKTPQRSTFLKKAVTIDSVTSTLQIDASEKFCTAEFLCLSGQSAELCAMVGMRQDGNTRATYRKKTTALLENTAEKHLYSFCPNPFGKLPQHSLPGSCGTTRRTQATSEGLAMSLPSYHHPTRPFVLSSQCPWNRSTFRRHSPLVATRRHSRPPFVAIRIHHSSPLSTIRSQQFPKPPAFPQAWGISADTVLSLCLSLSVLWMGGELKILPLEF